MESTAIRLARPEDLAAINAIYNHYVLHSTCTYQTDPDSEAERAAWFEAHDSLHPITVAERSGEILGWASLSKFHARTAYSKTVEDSVYVRHNLLGCGIGKMLFKDIIERARKLDHHTIVALISADQETSLRAHRAFNFVEVARLREVGYKFNRWLDVIYMQLML